MAKMVKIRMNTLHASATEVLHEGKVYSVRSELAKQLCTNGSGADGKPAARLARGSELHKATRPPAKPDPGEPDKPDVEEDDDEIEDNTEKKTSEHDDEE